MLVGQPDSTSRVWDLSAEKLKGDTRPASPVARCHWGQRIGLRV